MLTRLYHCQMMEGRLRGCRRGYGARVAVAEPCIRVAIVEFEGHLWWHVWTCREECREECLDKSKNNAGLSTVDTHVHCAAIEFVVLRMCEAITLGSEQRFCYVVYRTLEASRSHASFPRSQQTMTMLPPLVSFVHGLTTTIGVQFLRYHARSTSEPNQNSQNKTKSVKTNTWKEFGKPICCERRGQDKSHLGPKSCNKIRTILRVPQTRSPRKPIREWRLLMSCGHIYIYICI